MAVIPMEMSSARFHSPTPAAESHLQEQVIQIIFLLFME